MGAPSSDSALLAEELGALKVTPMACCASCDSKSESEFLDMEWGPQGFKIVNDDTFTVPADSEFAGWKTGYGAACDCRSCGCGSGRRYVSDLPKGRRVSLPVGTGSSAVDRVPGVQYGPVFEYVDLFAGEAGQPSASVTTSVQIGRSDHPAPVPIPARAQVTSADGSAPVPRTVAAVPECCIAVMCGGIPIFEWSGVVHCWIEKQNCNETEPSRFDMWQNDWMPGFDVKPGGPLGHILRNGQPSDGYLQIGGGVGGVFIEPFSIFEECYSCSAEENPCDCIDAEMKDYRWKDSYTLLGHNSNTFVGNMTAYCGLIGQLSAPKIVPVGAVGWDYGRTGGKIGGVMVVMEPSDGDKFLRKKGQQAMERRSRYRATGGRPPWRVP